MLRDTALILACQEVITCNARFIGLSSYKLALLTVMFTDLQFMSQFSVGFASGLSGGVCHQFTPFWSRNAFVTLEVCFA